MSAGAPRWFDGRLVSAGEALPAHTGQGVFETLRCEHGAAFFTREHLARLEHGARTLALAWPPPWDPLAALRALARELGAAPVTLRLSWTPPHLALVARSAPPPPVEAAAFLAEPGSVEPPRPFGVKTTARAAYDALRAETLRRGAFEGLVQTCDGELIEGTITNLFVGVAGELVTPPLAAGALPGIVRAAILTELEQAPLWDGRGRAWRARERALGAAELAAAEEVLLTNSVVRVLGLCRILGGAGEVLRSDLPGADGPLARALLQRVALLESATRDP